MPEQKAPPAPDHLYPDVGIGGRGLRVIGELCGEVGVQRVEHLGTVQGDGAHPVPDLVENTRLHGPGRFPTPYLKPRMSRAMTMRWISEVPSPISVSLASRKIRSIGNSVM